MSLGPRRPCSPHQRSRILGKIVVKEESFESYAALWRQQRDTWPWPCLFVLPFWLEAVHQHIGAPGEPCILSVHDDHGPVGVAPLALQGRTAAFLGSHEVCDYQDLISAPGKARPVLEAILEHLRAQKIERLDLRTLRPDAVARDTLKAMEGHGIALATQPDNVSCETELPGSWEDYLEQLNSKQRHEVRRKIRRLETCGAIAFRLVDNDCDLERSIDLFLALFRRNRFDKAQFMSGAMPAYFRDIIRGAARAQLLRLYFLSVEGQAAAAVLCFDYKGTRYLYNNGYDEAFEPLSIGTLSKIFSIRSAIESGCRRYDFLKGPEVYKKRLGGREVPLYRYLVEI